MRSSRAPLCLLMGVLALAPALLVAQSPPSGPEPLALAASDSSRSGSRVMWTAAGGAFAGALLLDGRLQSEGSYGGPPAVDRLSRLGNRLGRPQTAVPILAATYLVGRVAEAPRVSQGALHVTAALAAAGVVNGTLKYSIGRRRPRENDDPLYFRPFNADNAWQSFPSGHVMVAFSLAAAIAEEAGRPWVTALTYGTAGMVGWSRMYEDRHWASDVVGGAILGTAVSRATVRLLHRSREEPRVAISPAGISIALPVGQPSPASD